MKFKDELLSKFMIRKNKKQKDEFIDWVKKIAKDNEYEVNLEKGEFGARNIVIGNVDDAKVIYTAHYDTCANMFFPNFITPTNVFIYILYQMVLLIPLIGFPLVGSLLLCFIFPGIEEFAVMIADILMLFSIWMIMFGPANKNTVNDNTSGVLTILEMIAKIPDKDKEKVAFILFDYEEIGLIGSSSFASAHKDIAKNKLLINFDCVSDGEKVLFVFGKKAKEQIDLFKDSYKESDKVGVDFITKGAFYPSDQINFKHGVGVCAVIKGKRFEYIDKIHTIKDTVLREENINYLVDNSINLIKKM